MSLHINLTEEAEQAFQTQKRRNLVAAILTAVLCSSLLAILLYIAVIVIPEVSKPEVIAYSQDLSDAPPSDKPVTQERTQARPAAPSSNQASLITSTAVTSLNVASVDIDAPDAEISFSTDGFGDGFDGMGEGGGGFGGEKAEDSTLEGTFYDFKQTRDGAPTNVSPDQALDIMHDFVTKNWKATDLSKYFQSQTKLYASQFYISYRNATEAPKAYQCEDKVKDSRWCAVYRGKVVAPKSGKFRFVGVADDCIAVRFNKELVLDYGMFMLSYPDYKKNGKEVRDVMAGKKKNAAIEKLLKETGLYPSLPVQFYTYTTTELYNNRLYGFACGKTFEVQAGRTYPIEVLISEVPGGQFGAALLIEEIGNKTYAKDPKTGAPILPLFRTNYAQPDPKEINGIMKVTIPFDKVSPIWKAVK